MTNEEATETTTAAKGEAAEEVKTKKQPVRKYADREMDEYLKEKEALLKESRDKSEDGKDEAPVEDVPPAPEIVPPVSEDDDSKPEPSPSIEKPLEKPGEMEMLISEESYLTAGVHIGTQQKSAHMKPFLYRVRNDGLYVLNVKLTDQKLQIAAKFLGQYDPKDILVVSARQYGQRPVRKMARALGNMTRPGRFVPGTLTNPNISQYVEPKVLVVTDPAADAQAMREAISVGIPIVGLCDANNLTKYVDLVVPGNNKGRKALALMYYLLTVGIMKERGLISDFSEFEMTTEDFEESL